MDDHGMFDIREVYGAPSSSAKREKPLQQPIIYDETVAAQLEHLDEEILSVKQQLSDLQKLHTSLVAERKKVYNDYLKSTHQGNDLLQNGTASKKLGTDYTRSDFAWSSKITQAAQQVFGIQSFRMCQEAVCNAAMDGRDTMVVMPTGGGKSLCYQLPAILHTGVTLVVSPLISLMTDQVFHLREIDIESELMCSANSREESNEILRKVRNLGAGPAPSPSSSSSSYNVIQDGIKLLYVTPERIAKSKTLLSALQKAYEQGRLSRIVIDEAHCCSQMGHDYRPDYKRLSILRKLFPTVPIMCLTATCGPKVLKEILKIINLNETTEPDNAAPRRTLYFTAPLFRPNLVYKVLQRPQNVQAAHQAVADYIMSHHSGKSGIVYCLSKKDTHTMADALYEVSKGRIRTGVYHADLEDDEKHTIHRAWRVGKISVVCATIAFGMGIDKGDVRFVIHACISKSLDGYYQETGRAGRDGQKSDCVLMYRPQDASRVSGLVASEPTGQEKLHAMLKYAQSPKCRKVLFGDYFVDMFGSADPCGICDNCNVPQAATLQQGKLSTDMSGSSAAEQLDLSTATFEAWQLVQIASEVHGNGGRVTLSALADLARGLGGGKYTIESGRRRGGGSGKAPAGIVDLSTLCDGKVTLSKDNCERLIVELLLRRYLDDEYHQTAYTVNVYVRPGPQAMRLARLSAAEARTSSLVQLYHLEGTSGTERKSSTKSTPAATPTKATPSRTPAITDSSEEEEEEDVPLRKKPRAGTSQFTAIEID